ncbi:hypothetical protein FPV67DRAFT_1463120 [Lyophyllum atratum]|nr:hypothetical protein FPV67DRAFT_1463120 [Lyophyllum atratum]
MSGSTPQPIPPSILALPPYATTSPSRLQALYSDISRQKHSNPTSYQSNIEWWRKALQVIVSSGLQTDSSSRLTLRADARLMERVRVEGVGKPLALGAVVAELLASKALIPQAEFLSAKDSIYDPGWLPGRIVAFVVGKPLWWVLEQMGVVGEEGLLVCFCFPCGEGGGRGTGETGDEDGRRRDRLFSFDGFRRDFGSALGIEGALTEADATVLLRFLERDRKAALFDKEVIKFLIDDPSVPREINAADRGILELRGACAKPPRAGRRCTQKATAALQQKRKPIALSHIRVRKQLEDLLSKRLGSLENLESTLLRVEAAAGDIQIMKSYESSTATLRAILAHPSLQKESIEATMDALAEVNADAKEVDEAVRIGADVAVGVGDMIDDADLEDELRALIQEDEQEKQGKVDLDKERAAIETRARLERVGELPNGVPSPTIDATRSRVALA